MEQRTLNVRGGEVLGTDVIRHEIRARERVQRETRKQKRAGTAERGQIVRPFADQLAA